MYTLVFSVSFFWKSQFIQITKKLTHLRCNFVLSCWVFQILSTETSRVSPVQGMAFPLWCSKYWNIIVNLFCQNLCNSGYFARLAHLAFSRSCFLPKINKMLKTVDCQWGWWGDEICGLSWVTGTLFVLMSSLNLIFQWCEHHKQICILLHCIEVVAELSVVENWKPINKW